MIGIDRAFKKLLATKAEVVVNTPPERVFGHLADVPNHAGWMLVGTVNKISEGPVSVGSTFTFRRLMFFPRFFSNTLRVTELVPNRRLAWQLEATYYHYRLRYTFDLQPTNGGTRISGTAEWVHFGPYLTIMALLSSALTLVAVPPLRAESRATLRRGLNRIQSLVGEQQWKRVM
jgi:uncharacterized protein YndB with AHSA1/START domain